MKSKTRRRSKPPPDWFGCGRIITQQSWNRFLAARAEYYMNPTHSLTHSPTCPPCPTFPLRPINGGPLPNARPKSGDWYYEPKYNGWRALVHVPTGTMFNREGERLSIEKQFASALNKLKRFAGLLWADCEGLERRHGVGHGCLILLDLPDQHFETYRVRHRTIVEMCSYLGVECLDPEDFAIREREIYFSPAVEDHGTGTPQQLWDDCLLANRQIGVEFFEGLVAKRADSVYPLQLRSPKEEFHGWMKHRWAY